MSIVSLVSGGLDSTVMVALARDEGLRQFPLFIDYGQRSCGLELAACRRAMSFLGVPDPEVAALGGYGALIRSGLTDSSLHVIDDAFTPGRNLLFLLIASAYAYQVDADGVAIGLLNESTSLFPDQTSMFLNEAEGIVSLTLGRDVKFLAPLSDFYKQEVVALAATRGISNTYSCHVGGEKPCGECIACKEFEYRECL